MFLFFLPELPWVLAWMLLGAPTVGLLDQWIGTIVEGAGHVVNVYSYAGMVVLGAVRSATVLFLFVHPAFLAMDATLEEAARMAGRGRGGLARINFPLLLPALLASGILSFVVAMESFEIPQLLGTPGEDLRVHDPDLRPRLRRPRRELRSGHRAGRAPARPDA